VTARLVNLATAAALLHVSEETVKRLAQKGLLQPVREPGKMVAPQFRQAEIMADPRTRLGQLALPLEAKP
jgi:predicted site-specific integrase-resolvase